MQSASTMTLLNKEMQSARTITQLYTEMQSARTITLLNTFYTFEGERMKVAPSVYLSWAVTAILSARSLCKIFV